MKTRILILSGILLLSFGCANVDDLSKEDNAAYPIEIQAADFSLPESCTWKYHAEQNNVYVIRSVEGILPFIDGKFPGNLIDFGKYSLIYARGMGTSGIDDITKQLQQISANEYLLYVEVTNNGAEIAPLWNIAILVPVIPQNTIVKLNVNVFPKNVTWVQIAQGNLYGHGEEGFSREGVVIKTDSEWEAFKQKINRTNNVVDMYFIEKKIDFSTYQIIAVFDEVKGSGGWSIDITQIIEWQDKITVYAENMGKGNGTRVITQPFQIVKIPVSEKAIEFDDDKDNETISPIAGEWKVKSQNMSGELTDIISPPENAHYPDISIQIPDTIKGHVTGNTFRNQIGAGFEIKDSRQIHFENYGGTRLLEDDWGRAFENNLRNTVKFVISNNELIFLDLQDKPIIVFTHK
jgi:hypothetical protein